MEAGVWWHWRCVQAVWRAGGEQQARYRRAMKKAAEQDGSNRPSSASVRAVSGGLPTLGKRRR